MAGTSFMATSGGGGMGTSLSSQLPRLTQETELQKMLSDERMRSEQHKTNYQQLKSEHSRLQDEYMQLQNEVRTTIEESRIVQEKYKTMYDQTRQELAERMAEIEDLKTKVISPQRLEILKMQVIEDLEVTYREKYQKQEQEIDEHRTSQNKLRYELSFVKSEYEHEKLEHQRILEEMKLQCETEVSNLRKERDSTINRVQTECSQDSQKVRVLQRENAQLHLKLKGLLSELEEIRSEREKLGLDSDSVSRIQSKQLSENVGVIKALEAERESLKKQSESLLREISQSSDEHNKLTSRIHDLEKENMVLSNRADEVSHKSKVDLTNLKMEMLKQRGELERERDRLSNLVEDLQTQIEINEHKIRSQAQTLEEKEREAVRRVQAAREEEFHKMATIESEKMDLEAKLQEVERQKIDQESYRHADQQKVEDRVRAISNEREAAEKELLVYKTKIQHFENLQDQIERERSENSELKSKVHKLESELSGYYSNEQETTDQNIKLRNQVELLKEELNLTQEQLVKIQNNHDRILSHTRGALIEERNQLHERLKELEGRYSHVQSKLSKAAVIYKKYKTRSHKTTESLRDNIQILEAKNEELDLEKQALKNCVPHEVHNRLKKQWKDLYRRHQEFRAILLPNVKHVAIGDKSFAVATLPQDTHNLSGEFERQHQEDLRLLKTRLDQLDNNQRQQLEELHDIAHSTLLSDRDLDDSREKVDDEKLSMS
ncbi:hypothetical protein SNE40_014634 [Patella caerulea]|uniref:Centrosomal protein of 83 kDa n=1 Tax=Patella caerulea TaxID=87958 RepID=A0AAN8JIP0_PATCE